MKFGRVILHDLTKKRHVGLFQIDFLVKEVHLGVFFIICIFATLTQNYRRTKTNIKKPFSRCFVCMLVKNNPAECLFPTLGSGR